MWYFRLNNMKLILHIIILTLLSCNNESIKNTFIQPNLTKEVDASPDEQLFKVFANDHFGFINSNGKVVIDIKYKNALNFSEGMAAVREEYRFGYINHIGEFVIKPIFDAAEPFDSGLAKVYVNGSPAIINKSGDFVVQPNIFVSIDYFFDEVAIVTSSSGLYGGINTKGELVIDTIYKDISRFNSNRAVVTGFNYPDDIRIKKQEIGVIDAKGNLVVEFNKYFSIEQFNEGFAKVEVYNIQYDEESGWSSEDGIIDSNGVLMFQTKHDLERYVVDGFIKATVRAYLKYSTTISNTYDVFYNIDGEIVFKDFPFEYLQVVKHGLFINWKMNEYQVYDTSGKLLTPAVFNHAYVTKLDNKQIQVENEDGKWGLINTKGDTLIPCKYNSIQDVGMVNNRVFFREKIGDTYQYLWGLLDEKGDTVVPAKFTEVQYNGFESDIVYVEQDSIYGYINRDGEFVWKNIRGYENQSITYDLSSSNMLRAYCYVEPSRADSLKEKNEWVNYPKKITAKLKDKKFGIMVDTTRKTVFAKRYNGYYAYILNASGDTVNIGVQDGWLNMKMQVKDGNEWKDIEYIPNSWCGNSYYKVELLDGEYWELAIPKYDGEKEIEARLRLVVNDKYKDGKLISENVLYSNSFKCKINPGQFWNKQGYSPKGIMDPYFD